MLVLEISRNYCNVFFDHHTMNPVDRIEFSHERLDVYPIGIQFLAQVVSLTADLPRGHSSQKVAVELERVTRQDITPLLEALRWNVPQLLMCFEF